MSVVKNRVAGEARRRVIAIVNELTISQAETDPPSTHDAQVAWCRSAQIDDTISAESGHERADHGFHE